MKRPTDISLGTWIRKLVKQGKLYRFYKCDEWLELKYRVMEDAHYECEDCAAKGRYTRAYCVHHDQEVRQRPELALSRYWTDAQGNKHKNLWSLCYECHEKRHGRMYTGSNGRKHEPSELELKVPERW